MSLRILCSQGRSLGPTWSRPTCRGRSLGVRPTGTDSLGVISSPFGGPESFVSIPGRGPLSVYSFGSRLLRSDSDRRCGGSGPDGNQYR